MIGAEASKPVLKVKRVARNKDVPRKEGLSEKQTLIDRRRFLLRELSEIEKQLKKAV